MGKHSFIKHVFSLFLAFTLCFSALPSQVAAETKEMVEPVVAAGITETTEETAEPVTAVEATKTTEGMAEPVIAVGTAETTEETAEAAEATVATGTTETTDNEGGLYALEQPASEASSRNGIESAWFPAPRMLLTQVAYETASHGSCNAIDISPGGNVFAPFTGIIKQTDSDWGYVLFQSLNKVYYADGSLDYMTVGFMHDSNISDLQEGQVISQGTDFYQAGGMGSGNPNKYGVHVDISIFRGRINHVSSYGKGDTFAYDAFFINRDKTPNIINAGIAVNPVNNGSAKNWGNLWRYLGQPITSPTLALEMDHLGNNFYAYIHYPHGGDLNLANYNKNAVVAEKCMGDPRQMWHFIWDNSTNAYKIISMYDGLCLDLSNGTLSPDNNVGLVRDNGNIAQRWKIAKGAFSGVNILLPAGSNDFALDVYETATHSGANVQIWNTTGKEAQTFAIYKYTADEIKRELAYDVGQDFYAQISFNGMYLQTTGTEATSSSGGKYMDVRTTLTSNVSDPKQVWHFIKQNNGSYKIINQYSSWCLEVSVGIAQNKQNVWTWHDDNGNLPERWYVMKSRNDNTYRISSALSFPENIYSLDIPNGEKTEGANVEIYQQNEVPQQQFNITKLANYGVLDDITIWRRSHLLGDVNQDGNINQVDLKQVINYITGSYRPENDTLFQLAADINCDHVVNQQDVDEFAKVIIGTANSKGRYGICGRNAYWQLVNGTLTISGSGEMFDYTYMGRTAAPWGDYKEDIVMVVIEEGITNIGNYAFSYCNNLDSIFVPGTLSSIRHSAFLSCEKLETVSYSGIHEDWHQISIDIRNDSFKNATIYCNGQQLPATVPVTGITLNKSALIFAIGDSERLTATITPANATNQTVSWSSSNSYVASVSNGEVEAMSAGTAVITATTADGVKTASCTVTVNKTAINIEITKKPSKLVYAYGENLNTAGMNVSVLYNDDSTEVVDGWTVSGYDPNLSGLQMVTVHYREFTTVFYVAVSEPVISGNVAKPQMYIESFMGGKRVILSSATPNAQIRYTTDGSIPTAMSSFYSGQPIELTSTQTIKAIAILNGVVSNVTSSKIAVSQVSTPITYPVGSRVKDGTIVTLRSDTAGSIIYYTLNGTYPKFDENGNCKAGTYIYDGAIVLHDDTRLWAIAVKDGFCNSGVAKAQYAVEKVQQPRDEATVSLGSVSANAGVVASVPLYLFSSSNISSFQIKLNFEKDAFENFVTITPAEGINSAKLFSSVDNGAVNILYTGEPIEGDEICTLNFTSLASQSDTVHSITVDLANSFVSTREEMNVELSAVNGNIRLGKTQISQISGEVTYTKPNGTNIHNINQAKGESEIEASVSIGETTNVSANVYLVIYDQDERMVSIDTWKVDLSDPTFMLVQTIKIPQNIQVGAIKIMLLSDQMVPLMAVSKLAN